MIFLAPYTKCNYKLVRKCEVIFYQDDEKKYCIAAAHMLAQTYTICLPMEHFFEKELMKKNEQIGLIYGYYWY